MGKGKRSSKKASPPNKTTNQRQARDIQTPERTPGPARQELELNDQNEENGEKSPVEDEDDIIESNLSDFSGMDEDDRPVEDQPDPIPKWVQDVMIDAKDNAGPVEAIFNLYEDSPDYQACDAFFARLNQTIRAANEQNDASNLDAHTVPEMSFSALCQTMRAQLEEANKESSPEKGWIAVHNTQDLLMELNKRHGLPRKWNLSSEAASRYLHSEDPDPRQILDPDGLEFYDIPAKTEPAKAQPGLNTKEELSELEALEARAIREQRPYNSAKVLRWWPKGSGSQTFVQYGSPSASIYRIRAGSYENYNPTQVERVLTSLTRGSAKIVSRRNGIVSEDWKYGRHHIKRYVGVGWKIDNDDESGVDPLSWIQPSSQVVYPQTRILVEWKDGVTTLEGRSFIRRVTPGSALDGDKVIYQKASEMEYRYREEHEMNGDDEESDNETEDESDDQVVVEDADSTRSKQKSKSSRQIRFVESSDESDDDSDSDIQVRRKKTRRDTGRYQTKPRTGKKQNSQQMRHLQEELANLRLKLDKAERKSSGRSKRR